MKSTMKVRSTFDFRGETFCYELGVDLPPYIDDIDLFLQQLPSRIAQQNQLDVISYKFEMLESSEIEVIHFDSRIDASEVVLPMPVEAFLERYQQIGSDAYLQDIAQKHQLDWNDKTAKALKAAYRLGKSQQPKATPPSNHPWF
ncbi:MAG: hypothetical protein AB7C96_10215 [Hydrogenovibrio sp.]